MLQWFLVGLFLCAPASVGASTWAYELFGREPVWGWGVFAAVCVVAVSSLLALTKWSRKVKESWFAALLGMLVGGGFFWGIVWSHPH